MTNRYLVGGALFVKLGQGIETVCLVKTVCFYVSKDWARASRCSYPPVSSKSEFETVPLCGSYKWQACWWFIVVTCDATPVGFFSNLSFGNKCLAGNHMQHSTPIPDMYYEVFGRSKQWYKLYNVVQFTMSLRIQRNSPKVWWTPLHKATWSLALLARACYIWLHMCWVPETLNEVLQGFCATLLDTGFLLCDWNAS